MRDEIKAKNHLPRDYATASGALCDCTCSMASSDLARTPTARLDSGSLPRQQGSGFEARYRASHNALLKKLSPVINFNLLENQPGIGMRITWGTIRGKPKFSRVFK